MASVVKFQSLDERKQAEHEARQHRQSNQQPYDDARALEDLTQEVHTNVYGAIIAQESLGTTKKSLEELQEVYPAFAKNPFEHAAKSLPAFLLPAAAIAVDTLIFSPTAEFFARMVFPDSPELVEASRWAVPMSFVGIETAIASFLSRARTEVRDPEGRVRFNSKVAFWMVCGGLTTFILPSLAVANLLAEGSFGTPSFLPRLLGLSLLSMVMHAAILFSGKYLHEAFVFLLFKRRQVWLRFLANRLRTKRYGFLQRALGMLRRLIHETSTYNARYDEQRRIELEPGVQQYLEQAQNEFVFREGNAPAAGPEGEIANHIAPVAEAPQTPPEDNPAVPDDPANAPDDDYTRVVQRHIARAEEEVKP